MGLSPIFGQTQTLFFSEMDCICTVYIHDIHIHTPTYMYIYIHTYVYTNEVHMYIYIYIYIHICSYSCYPIFLGYHASLPAHDVARCSSARSTTSSSWRHCRKLPVFGRKQASTYRAPTLPGLFFWFIHVNKVTTFIDYLDIFTYVSACIYVYIYIYIIYRHYIIYIYTYI